MQHAFAVHQLGHAHRVLVHGAAIDPNTLPDNIRKGFDKREVRAGDPPKPKMSAAE
jgi:hypothetical protein